METYLNSMNWAKEKENVQMNWSSRLVVAALEFEQSALVEFVIVLYVFAFVSFRWLFPSVCSCSSVAWRKSTFPSARDNNPNRRDNPAEDSTNANENFPFRSPTFARTNEHRRNSAELTNWSRRVLLLRVVVVVARRNVDDRRSAHPSNRIHHQDEEEDDKWCMWNNPNERSIV